MLIQKEQTKYHSFALSFEYEPTVVEYCQYLKLSLGWNEFQYDPDFKRWRFKDPEVINMLKNKFPYVQVSAEIAKEVSVFKQKKEEETAKEQNAKRIKEAKVSNLEIGGIRGELYNFQKLGVEFFINSGGRAILADDMGTGKTIQSLAYVVNTNQKRTLVISPASVKFSWKNECERWTKLKSFVVDSKTKFADIPYNVDVVIVNYDVLKKHFNELMKYKWNCLICDEAHMIKNTSAIRTKAVKAIAKNIPSVLLLSGTPLVNRTIELYNLLNIVDPKVWNNWYSYAVKYCGGHQGQWGFEAKGSSNLDELKQRIGKYFLRRTKEEVLPELPPKIRTDVPMELIGEFHKQYKTAASSLAQYLRQYKKETDSKILKAVQAEKLVRINYLRQISSMAKVETAKELIQNIIDTEEKVVVFSCFNAPLLELQKSFPNESVMIIGDVDVGERGEIVKKFQEKSQIKVFLCGIKSGGVGLTLTAASNTIFIDYSWSSADMIQAEDRIHRLGQGAMSVNIYQIISKNTIDDFLKKLIENKKEIFDQLFGNEIIKKSSIIEEFIKKLE